MSSTDRRVILVTGANKGIGFEAVRLLSEQLPSATILLGTRSQANGDDAIAKLHQSPDKSHSYTNLHPLVIDVTDASSIASAVDQVKAKYGQLDVLVNNSGISEVDSDHFNPAILDVNLHGVHRTITAFLPILNPHGSLVTVSSELGCWYTHLSSAELQQQLFDPSMTYDKLTELGAAFFTPTHGPWPKECSNAYGLYSLSKVLVSAYMRIVAREHPHLKVVTICPGYCATDLNHNTGHRKASEGAESVIFPVVHADSAESGKFYQDGKVLEWSAAPPSWYKPPPAPTKQTGEKA